MEDTILELGKFLISTSVLGGLIIWLFKEFTKFRFSKDLEENKAKIDNYFYQEKTKFSKIYDEQAVVIKTMYSKLRKLHKSFNNYYSSLNHNSYSADFQPTIELINDFKDYYEENRIILDDKICQKIENSIDLQNKIFIQFAIQELRAEIKSENVDETIIAIKNLLQNEIPNTEKLLESEFKKILGAISK